MGSGAKDPGRWPCGVRSRLFGALWLPLLGLVLTASCGPIVQNAPFTVRPDSLQPGDLLGPFDGTVVDAETDRPIAGATVDACWEFERGIGLEGPGGMREFSMDTGADGRYEIPSPDTLPTGNSMRLRRFTLIVYRRGYVGYRSDFRFGSGEPRHDFSQHGNKARLEKWQPKMEHRKHLAFLGGGKAIARAASWEAQPASLEYEGLKPVPVAGEQGATLVPMAKRMLDASPLLSAEEVRGVTGYAGEFEVGRLLDQVRSDVYDSRHFKAKGKSEAFDVGLRVWALTPAGAEARFKKLASELPSPVETEEIGDRSVRAHGGDVLGLAFLLREKGLVLEVSCGVSQCTDPSMVLRLAKLVEGHLSDLKLPRDSKTALPSDAAKKDTP